MPLLLVASSAPPTPPSVRPPSVSTDVRPDLLGALVQGVGQQDQRDQREEEHAKDLETVQFTPKRTGHTFWLQGTFLLAHPKMSVSSLAPFGNPKKLMYSSPLQFSLIPNARSFTHYHLSYGDTASLRWVKWIGVAAVALCLLDMNLSPSFAIVAQNLDLPKTHIPCLFLLVNQSVSHF